MHTICNFFTVVSFGHLFQLLIRYSNDILLNLFAIHHYLHLSTINIVEYINYKK